jgi:hypothetical protein
MSCIGTVEGDSVMGIGVSTRGGAVGPGGGVLSVSIYLAVATILNPVGTAACYHQLHLTPPKPTPPKKENINCGWVNTS